MYVGSARSILGGHFVGHAGRVGWKRLFKLMVKLHVEGLNPLTTQGKHGTCRLWRMSVWSDQIVSVLVLLYAWYQHSWCRPAFCARDRGNTSAVCVMTYDRRRKCGRKRFFVETKQTRLPE